MGRSSNGDSSRLNEAARAGWLYYVARNTQDEIARKLGVSRQSAQRLVSLAVSERLIKVRIDHPISDCMELAQELSERYGLELCEVVPSDPDAPDLLDGIAIAAAEEIERVLKSPEPRIIAMGTGRALRAAVEEVPGMDCPQHRIVSLLGNMMNDGSASPFNVVIRLAERVNARHYPMPLPVLARNPEELRVLHAQEPVRNTMELCRRADVCFVGVGNIDETAPLVKDGFVRPDESRTLEKAGAVGEITGWSYDSEGRLIPDLLNARIASAPLQAGEGRPMIGLATGASKVEAIRGALKGGLLTGLITSEATARALLGKA
ncbi:DNA-binding transcriptional regulator LsrR, DeoR family [Tranquillimonas rosea]|uniref:DNA-binding transcriptional regulator LsrR, DeoR family n=1 Tax=Tranquillimonas rosea TaxID=641238 RepID=A0A1H9Q6C1_9RHOB|nr:sugar-binding transcriptional regulator [Tranquillimonas rosea]SER55968.1 DNA-binding transcriptional regulator LsrR, DeoR family [Tranquillimonas rosea]